MKKHYWAYLAGVVLFVLAIVVTESTRERGPPAISLIDTVTVEYPVKCGLIFALTARGLLERGDEYHSRIMDRKSEVLSAEAVTLYGADGATSKAQAYVDLIKKEVERVHHSDFVTEMVGACEGYYGDRPPSIP